MDFNCKVSIGGIAMKQKYSKPTIRIVKLPAGFVSL